jgi:poly(3-hydroxybutyrate) depolymerase
MARMLYPAYEARRALDAPLHAAAAISRAAIRSLPHSLRDTPPVRTWHALSETVAALRLSHARPDFLIDSIAVDGEAVAVREEEVTSTAFGTLVRFAKESGPEQPRVLILPGLAGHFATLVRGTIRTMLPDHDVYVADWHNARDVPLEAGPFGLDAFIEHVIEYLEAIGPGTHLVAVCQPCPAALAAAAIMAENDHPAEPRSLTLMAGPIDAHVNPGPVNRFATRHSPAQLERTVLATVPWPHHGAGRRVYPGFLQAVGFISLDPRRHAAALTGMFHAYTRGENETAERARAFYDEYFAVLDIAAELYLDTARIVFAENQLARGEMRWRDRPVDPSAITNALLTVEAENDELCPPGQTLAAHALCPNIPDTRRHHHLQPGVGHYGVFSGSRFEEQIYPVIRTFIAEEEAKALA